MKKLLYILGGIITFVFFLDILQNQIFHREKYVNYYGNGETEIWPLTTDLFSILFSIEFIWLLIVGYIIYAISSVLLNFPKKKNQSSSLKK